MSDQVRKAINVSLQSKKYSESINEIIKDWGEKELNISAETCEALLLVHRLKKLSSLSNIFNIVKMLDNLSSIYHYDDTNIDEMLNQIIDIDNERFSQILIELNNMEFRSSEKVQKKTQKKEIQDKIITEHKTKGKISEENQIIEKKKEEVKQTTSKIKEEPIEIVEEKKPIVENKSNLENSSVHEKTEEKVIETIDEKRSMIEEKIDEEIEEVTEVPMNFLLNS